MSMYLDYIYGHLAKDLKDVNKGEKYSSKSQFIFVPKLCGQKNTNQV